MTQPAPPPFDTGNGLLGEQPANLTTALIETPRGQRLALTIRTGSTTVTIFLAKGDADTWARNLKSTADAMSASGLIVANGNGLPIQQGAELSHAVA